jgi:4-alpha-glucanotransferase
MGRYVPFVPVTSSDLRKLGFDKGRIRWLSQPHIPTDELWDALRTAPEHFSDEADIAVAAKKVFSRALERVGGEELWVFKKKIQGERDIDALGLHPSVRPCLLRAWGNRLFIEYERGKYSPTWHCRNSRAYHSLSEDEKKSIDDLLQKRMAKSEKIWEAQGKKLLSVLVESSPMLPCAEDLGSVPPCIPRVLTKLKILGLRVIRWHRRWDWDGQPYIPFEEYPELSVCTAAVHDSSTLREWWEREIDQKQLSGFIGFPSLPRIYNPGTARDILSKAASARSRFRVFQIQDLMHLSPKWYAQDPASERVNVPGTYNEFNWTYRLPASINEIGKDKDLVKAVAELSKIKAAKQQ